VCVCVGRGAGCGGGWFCVRLCGKRCGVWGWMILCACVGVCVYVCFAYVLVCLYISACVYACLYVAECVPLYEHVRLCWSVSVWLCVPIRLCMYVGDRGVSICVFMCFHIYGHSGISIFVCGCICLRIWVWMVYVKVFANVKFDVFTVYMYTRIKYIYVDLYIATLQ
jgi:hypothetical protein